MESNLFSKMVAVDIICANVLLAFLLIGVNKSKKIDQKLNANSSAIEDIKKRIESYNQSITRIPELRD